MLNVVKLCYLSITFFFADWDCIVFDSKNYLTSLKKYFLRVDVFTYSIFKPRNFQIRSKYFVKIQDLNEKMIFSISGSENTFFANSFAKRSNN